MRRNLLRIAVMGALFPLLASCGGNSVSNDTLVIGMECNYQPFNWTTTEASDYTLPIYGTTNEYADGYDVAVSKYLSEETGKDVVIKRLTWSSLIPSLQNGEINMVLAGMTDTSERRESIDFTDPYLSSDLAFLIRSENMPSDGSGTKEDPCTYDELLELFKGQTLICQASVVGDDFIDTYFTGKDSSIRHASPAATYPAAAQDVVGKTAFAMPAELPVIEAMTNLDKDNLSVLYCDYSFLSEEDKTGLTVSIGIKKGNDELKGELNSALAKLSDSKRSEMMGSAAARSADNA